MAGGWVMGVSQCGFSDRLWPKPRPWHLDLGGPSQSIKHVSMKFQGASKVGVYEEI